MSFQNRKHPSKFSVGRADHDLQCENVIKQELGSKPAHFHSLLGAVWIHSARVVREYHLTPSRYSPRIATDRSRFSDHQSPS